MARLEEILACNVQDVFSNLVDGLNRGLSDCKAPGNDYMALLLTFLCKENEEGYDCDRDILFCTVIQSLLHALKHWNMKEEKSAFDLLCKCISVCIKSSKKCSEILHSYLFINLQNYVAKVTENDTLLWEETEDKQIDRLQCEILTPIGTFFRLLFELTTENVHEEGIFHQEIFSSLLQVLTVDGGEAILPLLSQVIKMHIVYKESKKKVDLKLAYLHDCELSSLQHFFIANNVPTYSMHSP